MPSRHIRTACNLLLIVVFLTGLLGVQPARAQTEPPGERPDVPAPGLSYGYDSDSGRLNFIGGSADAPLLDSDPGLSALADVDAAAMALAEYGPAFGLSDPREELRLEKSVPQDAGVTLRYQQHYRGIPVLGGELLLNRDAAGNVTSLNGEVSPNLSLGSVQPRVSAAKALSTALAGMRSWYGLAKDRVSAGEVELWVYDPAIFEPSTAKPALVWRVDVRGDAQSGPVNELVLVNAASGRVALHFNQVNSAVEAQDEPPTGPGTMEEPPAGALFLSPDGLDQGDCRDRLAPCRTPNYAAQLSGDGDTLVLQAETFVGEINLFQKSVSISGGWNAGFTMRTGESTLVAPPSRTLTGVFISGRLFEKLDPVSISGLIIRGFEHGMYIGIPNSAVINVTLHKNGTGLIGSTYGIYRNVTISENGIAIDIRSGAFYHSTITDNRGLTSNIYSNGSDEKITLSSSIISANGTNCTRNTFFLSNGHNIFGPGQFCQPPQASEPTDLNDVDPKLTEILFGRYHAIVAGSPAIDALPAGADCPARDARGLPRPYGENCDIGAYEYMPAGAAAIVLREPINPDAYHDYSSNARSYVQSALLNEDFLYPIRAIAIDELGSPVSGAELTFSTPGSGASAVFTDSGTNQLMLLTDAYGMAAATLRANDQQGWYTASVSAASSSGSTTSFELGNNVGSLFVDPMNGADLHNGQPNLCEDADFPCQNLDSAIKRAYPGMLIRIAGGEISRYYGGANTGRELCPVVNLDQKIILSGGWDASFRQQNAKTTITSKVHCNGIEFKGTVGRIDHINFSNLTNAVSIEQGSAKITNGVFTDNKCSLSVKQNGDLRSRDNEILGGSNGICVNNGHALVENNRIQTFHTGMEIDNGSVEATNSQFSGDFYGVNLISGQANLHEVSITRSQTGIKNNGGTLTLTNATVSNNVSLSNSWLPSWGVGLLNENNGTSLLVNVTLTNNIGGTRPSTQSGGLRNASGTVQVANSILAHNIGGFGADCSGEIISLGHNLVSGADKCDFHAAEGDILGDMMHKVGPRLGLLAGEDDEPQTIPLLAGSPALDSADPAYCPAIDARGVARAQGAGCDMGAYEGRLEGGTPPHALTYISDIASTLPGKLLCQSPAESCTGENIPGDADLAHRYALGTYRMFERVYGRYSVDDAEMPLLSTVYYTELVSNAFWNGLQVAYTNNFISDDVTAHEFGHGVTQANAHLLNYYQTGAISESISDMWGEYYDQTNGEGDDSPEVKWLQGEDLPGGAIRSLSDPTVFGDPDRMGSKLYVRDIYDNGGVHANAGVNNKAVYLMVEGGTFNKLQIRALGWDKVLQLYYHAERHYLTSGAGYDDLYMALNQSCAVMTDGAQGITADDCVQVRKALDAVEMSKAHSSFNPDAGDCPSGYYKDPTILFQDDFENGDSQWVFGTLLGNSRWSVIPGGTRFFYAASGTHALFGDDYDPTFGDNHQTSDTYAAMSSGVKIPSGKKVELFFHHAFGFEYYPQYNYYFDGGVLEYTTDNGKTWKDAGALYEAGQKYNGRLYNGSYHYNHLRSRSVFRAESHGYVASRYNLSKLAGKTVRFRWRLGTDYMRYFLGWAVDDVSIHVCVGKPGAPSLSSPSNNGVLTSYGKVRLDWKDSTYSVKYQVQVATDSAFNGIIADNSELRASEYTLEGVLVPNTRYYWRARGFNSAGIAGSWSSTRALSTSLAAPVLLAPENGAVVTAAKPGFQWEAVPGATSYSLQVSTSTKFSSNVISQTVKGTSYTSSRNLSAHKTYYWRVRANGSNPSAYTPAFTFTTP